MKLRKLPLVLFTALGLSVSPVAAQFIVFGPDVKVVFTQVEISGQTVTQAVATVSETDDMTNTTTVRRMTYVVAPIPDGSGGFDYERQVTQEETVVTPVPGMPGVFDVETTTEELETPVDVNDVPEGSTTTSTTVVLEEDVDEDDLDLPPSTEFFPIDEELEEPVVMSPA